MELKDKGIIIHLNDYKETDKLAQIFLYNSGLVSAKFAGVKKQKAKFKSVAQPFVFADFLLNQTQGKNTVISADVIDSFPGIIANYTKTICAYILLDIIKSLILTNKPEQDIFLLTLSSLKEIETQNEQIALINYILKFISFSGMDLIFADAQYVFLDGYTGNFVPQKQENCIAIDKNVYATLKAIASGVEAETKLSTLNQVLRLLHNIIYIKFNTDIKSFSFI